MARKKDKEKEKEESMGFGKEEKAEAAEAEKMKSGQMDERSVKTKEGATYDKMTGEVEGGVKFKDGNEKGLNAIVKIAEEVKVEQDHYAKVKTLTFGGKVAVENPSTVDRLWDIDVTLKGIEKTNLESGEIHIKELGTEEEDKVSAQEFELKGEATNLLVVKEYINTLPDADNILSIEAIKKNLDTLASKTKEKKNTEETGEKKETSEDDSGLEAFGISIAKDVNVTFAIAIKSLFDQPVKSIKVIKNIPDEFINVGIKGATAGTAEPKKQQIEWNIDELDPQNVVMLNFTATIKVETIEAKKTGTLEVTYVGQSSFAEGLAIDKFDAYTRNRFYVDILERDEQPGFWDCKLVFENSSEFNVDLFNADVYAPGDESKKFVDVDPNDVPRLPAGAQWYSNTWEYQSEEYPQFRKMLEFRVVPDFQTMVNGTIAIADVELAIASITGEAAYDITQVPSFKTKDVNVTLKITNNGSAPLNELAVSQKTFTGEYQPPKPEEVKMQLDGAEVEVAAEAIKIENNELIIQLKDLKDTKSGMIQKESTVQFNYPIHCVNPVKDSKFTSEILYTANTFPLSQELEFKPEVPTLEATHLRRKFRVGKEVSPIGKLGQYQIKLSLENIGEMQLQTLTLMDKVPENFEYGKFSQEPEKTDEVGADTLKWSIEKLEPGEKIEITYEITGTGEYSPSEAQLGL